jgi:hypothetical protein
MLITPDVSLNTPRARSSLLRLSAAKVYRFIGPAPDRRDGRYLRSGRSRLGTGIVRRRRPRVVRRLRDIGGRHPLDQLYRLANAKRTIGPLPALQVTTDAEDADDQPGDNDRARYQILTFELGLADRTETPAGQNAPTGTFYLFTTVSTEIRAKKHLPRLCRGLARLKSGGPPFIGLPLRIRINYNQKDHYC